MVFMVGLPLVLGGVWSGLVPLIIGAFAFKNGFTLTKQFMNL